MKNPFVALFCVALGLSSCADEYEADEQTEAIDPQQMISSTLDVCDPREIPAYAHLTPERIAFGSAEFSSTRVVEELAINWRDRVGCCNEPFTEQRAQQELKRWVNEQIAINADKVYLESGYDDAMAVCFSGAKKTTGKSWCWGAVALDAYILFSDN